MFESEVLEISDEAVRLVQHGSEMVLPKIDSIYIFAGGELPTDFLRNAGIEMELAVNKVVKEH